MAKIHPTAIIEPGAMIGKDVEIGPFCVVHANCVLEDRVVLKGNVWLDGNTTVGEETEIWPGAVIGTKTQDKKFRGEKTFVQIGKRCQIREFVTINSSCQEGSVVKLGDMCLIMAYCHVAHNCEIGNRVIMTNNASLAGHVTIEEAAIVGGFSGVHQNCRIGKYAMVGGMSRVTHDIPPYTIGAGNPFRFGGLNLIGLKRNGFDLKVRKLLTKAFILVFRSGLSLEEALSTVENTVELIPEVADFVAFFRTTRRGIIRGASSKSEPALQDTVVA